MRNGHVLYRIFDATGDLLYVGATMNPSQRFDDHSRHQPWWPDATDIKLERFDSAEELAAAEVAAIRTENPLHNRVHSGATPVWALKPRGPIGEGSVFQRGDGMWVGSCELPRQNGKRKQIRVYGGSREEAADKLAARKVRVEN